MGRESPISAQDHWSVLDRTVEVGPAPAARNLGVGVIAYFPLANGVLTGKVDRGTRLAVHPHWLIEQCLLQVENSRTWPPNVAGRCWKSR